MQISKKLVEKYEQFKLHSEEGVAPEIIAEAEKWAEALENYEGELTPEKVYQIGHEVANFETDVEYDYTVQVIETYWVNGKKFKQMLNEYEAQQNKKEEV